MRRLFGVLLLPLALSRAPAQERSLTVFAAASLTEAFTGLDTAFRRRNPEIRVRFNFAGSQQLAVQLEQGARADVFASADEQWMAFAREHTLLAGEPVIFARNRLVVIVPITNSGRIERLQDLAKPGIKLVLAVAAAPIGRYSREVLQNLARAPGFEADFQSRVLENVVSNEETVKGVVAKVQLGEADAGVVYRTDVNPEVARRVRIIDLPPELNVLASYPIAAVRGAADPAAGRAFVTFVLSPEGQAILRDHGFLPVSGP
jgi:molybdate transport system substrate-binding protein